MGGKGNKSNKNSAASKGGNNNQMQAKKQTAAQVQEGAPSSTTAKQQAEAEATLIAADVLAETFASIDSNQLQQQKQNQQKDLADAAVIKTAMLPSNPTEGRTSPAATTNTAAAAAAAAPPMAGQDLIDMNLTRAEQEQTKSGMINDLVSMLKLMEEAPPDSVEEFLKYLHTQVQQAVIPGDEGDDDVDASTASGTKKLTFGVDVNSRGLPKQKLSDRAVLSGDDGRPPTTSLEEYHMRHAHREVQNQEALPDHQDASDLLDASMAADGEGGSALGGELLPKATLMEFERKWAHLVYPDLPGGAGGRGTGVPLGGGPRRVTKKKGAVAVDLSGAGVATAPGGGEDADDEDEDDVDDEDLDADVLDGIDLTKAGQMTGSLHPNFTAGVAAGMLGSIPGGLPPGMLMRGGGGGGEGATLAGAGGVDPRQMLVDALFSNELFNEKDPFVFMPPGAEGVIPPSFQQKNPKAARPDGADDECDNDCEGEREQQQQRERKTADIGDLVEEPWASRAAGTLPFPTDLKGIEGVMNGADGGNNHDAATTTAPAGFPPGGVAPNGMSFEFLEDDLRDINAIIYKMAPLSEDSMQSISELWQLNLQGVDHLMMRTNVAERIRCLSVLFLLTVGRQYGAIPQNTFDDLLDSLSLCLWQGAALLGPKTQQHVATLFDLEENATHEQICVTITALGMTSFFTPLGLRTLETMHEELGLPALTTNAKEWGTRHEQIAHLLCQYFYPQLRTRAHMKLNCTVQLKVHENGPGRYTCTVDNARMLCIGLRQLYTSNLFSCSKNKFRAQLSVNDQKISFQLFHRNEKTPLRISLNVRTSGVEKGNNKSGGGGNKDSGKAADQPQSPVSLAEPQLPGGGKFQGISAIPTQTGGFSLMMEQECVLHEECCGFLDMLTLEDVFSNPRSSPTGLRLYSDDDRVTFQFSLEVEAADPEIVAEAKAAVGTGTKKSAIEKVIPNDAHTARQQKVDKQKQQQQQLAVHGGGGGDDKKDEKVAAATTGAAAVTAGKKNSNNSKGGGGGGGVNNNTTTTRNQSTVPADSKGVSVAELIEQEEEEKKAKKNKKAREKMEAKFQQLHVTESVARDTVLRNHAAAWTAIQEEMFESKQRRVAAKREQDALLEEERDELQVEVNTSQAEVSTLRNQCNKLAQERTALNKDLVKVEAVVESRQAVLYALRAKFEKNKATLEEQDEELAVVQEKVDERKSEADRIQELLEERESLRQERREADLERRARKEARKMRQAEAVAAAFKEDQANTTGAPGSSGTPGSSTTPSAITDFRSFWASNSDDPVFSPTTPGMGSSSSGPFNTNPPSGSQGSSGIGGMFPGSHGGHPTQHHQGHHGGGGYHGGGGGGYRNNRGNHSSSSHHQQHQPPVDPMGGSSLSAQAMPFTYSGSGGSRGGGGGSRGPPSYSNGGGSAATTTAASELAGGTPTATTTTAATADLGSFSVQSSNGPAPPSNQQPQQQHGGFDHQGGGSGGGYNRGGGAGYRGGYGRGSHGGGGYSRGRGGGYNNPHYHGGGGYNQGGGPNHHGGGVGGGPVGGGALGPQGGSPSSDPSPPPPPPGGWK